MPNSVSIGFGSAICGPLSSNIGCDQLTIDGIDGRHEPVFTHNYAILDSVLVNVKQLAVVFGRFGHKL